MSTSTRVTVRRVSAHVVEAERMVAQLAAMERVAAPGLMLGSTDVRHAAGYYRPGHYANYPQGLILLRRAAPAQLMALVCHEFQHHLDALGGIRCANPHSRHDDAFYARALALLERLTAYRRANTTPTEGRS